MTFQDLVKSTLGILSRRPHSIAEIKVYLSKKTTDTELVGKVINYLVEKQFLNDDQFSHWLVESRSRSKPRGLSLVKRELKRVGINFSGDIDELPLAKKALAQKQKQFEKLSSKQFRLKATSFLRYRGFSWTTIEKILKIGYNDANVTDE